MVEAETAYTLQSILLLGRLKRFADVTYYMISILVPLSGRDIPRVQCNGYLLISIRAPLSGRDLGATFFEEVASSISIHTPLSGRDARLSRCLPATSYFNPRSPLRERRVVLWES